MPPDQVALNSNDLYPAALWAGQEAAAKTEKPKAKSQGPIAGGIWLKDRCPIYICTHSGLLATRFLKEIFMPLPGTSIRIISTSARGRFPVFRLCRLAGMAFPD